MLCEYHILEYTCSELQVEGTPIAIVLYLDGNLTIPLQGFVLKSWEERLPGSKDFDISSIRSFLNDLGYYTRQDNESSRQFFKKLESLGVGLLRQFVSGACAFDDLDMVVSTYFGVKGSENTWHELFDAVEPSPLTQ